MKEKLLLWYNTAVSYLQGVDNLYLKFILTIIAISLIYIGFGLQDIADNLPSTFDGWIRGNISVD